MNIGFIGAGNMGSAIIGGIIGANIAKPEEITVSDINNDGLERIQTKYGVNITSSNTDTAEAADMLFLCVKPNVIYSVIEEIKDGIKDSAAVISIAAGQSLARLEEAFNKRLKLIRVMPNTPALVGEGMAAVSFNGGVTEDDGKKILEIFNSFGKAEVVPERLMDAVTAVSGSSPAYVFMLIEAMADAAVACGMPREQAYTFAAQAVKGSAEMVLKTGKHPAELKDMVCSPAGTTIDAVAELEKRGFRSSIIEAMRVCAEKSKAM